jgi:uncharacterized pyridoxamine 5'-phosphate oxidase family protein
MKDVVAFLEKNRTGCMSTVEGNLPHARPWDFMCEDGGKLWFCTANNKKVYDQMMKNPNVEYSMTSPEYETVRISGRVEFSKDPEMKKKVFASSALVQRIYQTPENPIFEVFCIAHGSVIVSDFSGQPPRTLTF